MYSYEAFLLLPLLGYVSQVMEVLEADVLPDPKPFAQALAEVRVPPPMCASYSRPDKSLAESQYSSRFSLG